ncbi:hypothetical protein HSBAA_49210 [Vreelandella sulfidaeris]|uniref:HTH lysR-type domain-containing protein n=1 Tax=Vreelandella sulfidaeris TaxID=115553 RepID=A0A455UC45_9GAMM|nr:hypothetical protein HSBAA_49210 [Halomonas sulfidaeris]
MQHWSRIEAFVEVVRLGTFSAAARHLKVSTSHISRLVSQLENQLGVQLLYRTTRQIRLTDAGATYVEHCRHLFDGLRDAEQALSELLRPSPMGCLNLPRPPPSASALSLHWLMTFNVYIRNWTFTCTLPIDQWS